ncbi:hypothetical protein [Spongiibacter sp.]|uniref:hypothetical protein n=1 Tax=Spongiibacter sp. TaxID=2024860 RepID=UPI0035687174
MLSYLELVELANGDIVLQRSEGDEQPLVMIRFSGKAREQISGSCLEIARAMVQAGLEAAQVVSEELVDDEDELSELVPQSRTVH